MYHLGLRFATSADNACFTVFFFDFQSISNGSESNDQVLLLSHISSLKKNSEDEHQQPLAIPTRQTQK